MAEAVLFNLTVKILSVIAKRGFKKAYEKAVSIWKAGEELEQLIRTIRTIQAALRAAEDMRESAEVKDWIERTKGVLYEADDLFDEVATNDLLKQQKGKKILAKVQSSVSKLNPVISNNSIAGKVKGIRKSLKRISDDMVLLGFVPREYEKSVASMSKGKPTGWHVEPKSVLGRDDAKKAIRDFLVDEKNDEKCVSVIAIVGIGGMGKSTLAQLVYSDENIQIFRKKWWAWISKASDHTEVIGKIFQSMTRDSYLNLPLGQLESGIRECISTNEGCTDTNDKFLLVIDDLWEEDRARGMKLKSLFSNCNAKGSKILVTTRSPLVARAMGADGIYNIDVLSWEASWNLFKSLAFTVEQQNDPDFVKVGEKIARKCANVPLAIESIASLLHNKERIEDWENIEAKELSNIELDDDSIMSALRLSYDHLPSHLKQCFAYCYLFPKGYLFCKEELIHLWIAQGYVKQESYTTVEEAGEACFVELLRSFFQEVKQDKHEDEIAPSKLYSMHSLMHDLAQRVAGQECIVLTAASEELHNRFRHLSVGYKIDNSWSIPQELLSCSGLRSSLFKHEGSLSSSLVEGLPEKFKVLRALNLGNQKIDKISSSIGELKHLRYLNLSRNRFRELPNSMTKLVNLRTLDISYSKQLEALPTDFRKLINLRHLDNKKCDRLMHMPPRFGELPCLRRLSYFRVSKAVSGGEYSGLDAFAKLGLTGELMISFADAIEDWNGDECWQLPSAIQVLAVYKYPDTRMPHWGLAVATDSLRELVRLQVTQSSAIKLLPPFRFLPALKALELSYLDKLEYVEEEESVGMQSAVAASPSISLPCLEELKLCHLPNLMGWAMAHSFSARNLPHQMPSFPRLSNLKIQHCENLKYMPLCPSVETLELEVINEDLMQLLLLSSTTPSSFRTIVIWGCTWLKRFPAESLTSLRFLELGYCNNLKHLFLAPSQPIVLEELVTRSCPSLVLWGGRVVWDSLPKLRVLSLNEIPNEDTLPHCLRSLQSTGQLEIKKL